MKTDRITLKLSEDDPDVGYIYLPCHPGAGTPGAVDFQKNLRELIKDYKGPDVYLDFNSDNELIGVEIHS